MTKTASLVIIGPKVHQLDPALKEARSQKFDNIIVICPHGKGWAKRAYEYLNKQGVPEEKLAILTGGMAKWPQKEWVTAN